MHLDKKVKALYHKHILIMETLKEIRELLPHMAEFHMALSDVNRLRMIRILATEKDVTVGELAKRLGISQPAVSQHLRILKMTGLLVPERHGNRTIYRIDVGQLEKYRSFENEMYDVVLKACEECDPKEAKQG
jgi:ArsR family transcriptional regulator, arsenate/arsenite/antimonite-responsive transcriptional repressor